MRRVKWALLTVSALVVLFFGWGAYLSGQSPRPVITATVGDSTVFISGRIASNSNSTVAGGSRWLINGKYQIDLIGGALSVNGVPMGKDFHEARIHIQDGKPLTSKVDWQLP